MVFRSLQQQIERHDISTFDTVYIGGGTPLSLDVEWFERLSCFLKEKQYVGDSFEWTVELNPEHITKDVIIRLQRAGVNRFSVGVQSFDDTVLRAMGRRYTVEEAERALHLIRQQVDNLSVDMIYGVAMPRSFTTEMTSLLDCITPDHVSCYAYSLPHKQTALLQADDKKSADEEFGLSAVLRERGFVRYEVSNWARAGKESLHNMVYWRSGCYVGVGAAAHSFIRKKGLRLFWKDDISGFIRGEGPQEVLLERKELIEEFLMMGLRLTKGIELDEFAVRFGVQFEELFPTTISRFVQDGLVCFDAGFFCVTDKGMNILNDLLLRLFAEGEACEYMS